MKKGTMVSVLFVLAALLFSACGKSGNDNVTENSSEVEYAYVAKYTKIGGGEWVNFVDIQFAGDNLFYKQLFFDVVKQEQVPVLKQYSLTENKILQEMDMRHRLEDGQSRYIGNYYAQKGGRLYTTESIYSSTSRQELLCAYDVEWNLIWEQDITDILDKIEKRSQVNHIAVDSKGRICLAVNGTLCLFDAEGLHLADVMLVGDKSSIDNLGVDRDGGVYACYREQKIGGYGYCLAQVDFEKGAQGSIYQNFPNVDTSGAISAGLENDFLTIGTDYLYGYDIATQSAKELLPWAEYGMDGVDAVGIGENGEILAFWWASDTREGFLVTMEKVEAASLPKKTQVVIGCMGNGYQQEVAAFNRQSDNCYVTVKNYAVAEDGTRKDSQDVVTEFGMALATGIDCPDILVLDDMESDRMDIEAMAENGAFADLEPFLEESTLLQREDYLENALDFYRYAGALVGIPSGISIETVAGKTSDVGEESGWTLQEMMAYAAAHPGKKFWYRATRESILNDCLALGLGSFVDWKSGQCRFATADFKEFLAFMGRFPEKLEDYGTDERSVPRQIKDGDILLYPVRINRFEDIQEYPEMFQTPVTYIGYPTVEGSGCIADCSGALALSAQSANKEAAWEFIEYHLERQSDCKTLNEYGEFSTRKSILDRQMEEAVTVSYYLDDDGNPILDADGNPIPQSLGGYLWDIGDEIISYHTPTEEEVQCVRELIESASKVQGTNSKITEMILEEAQPFFQGQKSLEEVADIIQSRVQLYIDER
ncbi:MAG: extracellular solute-binding protein [Acetatifactor sp.]|nr:extracellular solute-binding protein [Acetatifactor sp.]